jgi:hypothetical protein
MHSGRDILRSDIMLVRRAANVRCHGWILPAEAGSRAELGCMPTVWCSPFPGPGRLTGCDIASCSDVASESHGETSTLTTRLQKNETMPWRQHAHGQQEQVHPDHPHTHSEPSHGCLKRQFLSPTSRPLRDQSSKPHHAHHLIFCDVLSETRYVCVSRLEAVPWLPTSIDPGMSVSPAHLFALWTLPPEEHAASSLPEVSRTRHAPPWRTLPFDFTGCCSVTRLYVSP